MSSDGSLVSGQNSKTKSQSTVNTPTDELPKSRALMTESSQPTNENDSSIQSEDDSESAAEFEKNETLRSLAEIDESSEDKKLTTWESFTAILRGLVEELIELGAQPQLRKISFQLWAFYLKNENIAFNCKSESKIPTLPARFKNLDAEALFNVKNLREIIKTDSMNEHKSRALEKKKSNQTRSRIRVKIPSPRHKPQEKTEQSHAIGRYLDTTEPKRNVKIAIKESAFKRIAEPAKEFMRQKEKHGENIPSNVLPYIDRRYRDRRLKSNAAVTVNTLLAILKLALYLIEDDVQLSDLLRWACEGKFSLYRVKKFLPKNAPIRETDVTPSQRKNFFKFDLLRICEMFKLTDIPSPDLFKLIQRYCDELSLPREFAKFTQKLMNMFTPHMDFALYNYRVFPDYECRAMGFIVFAMKLLFSVDDLTELKQSHFADTVNKCNKETPPLFSWSSWVKYVECRKAVLCKYDVTMSQLYEYDDAETDIHVFLNYWSKNEPNTSDPVVPYELFKQDTINRLSAAAEDHCPKDTNSDTKLLQFPSSLSPLKTYTQYLLTQHPTLLSDRCKRILSDDFSSHSVRYLMDHEWAIDISKDVGFEIESIHDSAISKQVHYVETESDLFTAGKTTPAHIPTPVMITDDTEDYDSKNDPGRLKKFKPKFTEFTLSEPIISKHDSLLELHSPSTNYWFFHHIDRSMKNENFNKIATENFSVSFLWLLKECSRILRCSLYDLYTELVIIERVYGDLFSDIGSSTHEKLLVYSNEW